MAERDNLTPAWQEPSSLTEGATERSADEIRQDIAARRESISETVDRLSDRFQRTFDWRTYVSDYPLAALGVAAGLGFLASRIFKPRPTPGERMKDALAHGFEDMADRFRHRLGDFAPHKSRSGLGTTVKAAATGVLTKALTDYLRGRLADRFADADERYAEYMPEYTARHTRHTRHSGYQADSAEMVDYPGSAPEDWRGARKKGSEPRH
ncbi:MAG: hypothetical protein ACREAB_03595 [Blastocatellia bacterium]